MTEFPQTRDEWARAYIMSTDLAYKIAPAPAPDAWGVAPVCEDHRQPGRPAELRVSNKRQKSIKLGILDRLEARAEVHHRFWHHELQAAELMCWAMLRFAEAPTAFRDGLIRIFRDEVRHMSLYQAHIESLGYQIGDFEVRDWFWERIPTCETPLQFVALLGMGLEGANLDHTARFSGWLRAVGDTRGAELQEQVGREEIGHVRFATRWFREWSGGVDFDVWCDALPPPLSPMLMKGKTIQRDARLKAEFPEAFLQSLAAWEPDPNYRDRA